MDPIIIALILLALLFIILALNDKKGPFIEDKKESTDQDVENLKKKFAEAESRASAIRTQQLQIIEQNRKASEKKEKNMEMVSFKKRRPTIDEIDDAIEGYGIELKVVGMKYKSLEEQIETKCLEKGDPVILIQEISSFSKTEIVSVLTTGKTPIGNVVTEQYRLATSLFYDDKLVAYVKMPWEENKSFMIVVVPGEM